MRAIAVLGICAVMLAPAASCRTCPFTLATHVSPGKNITLDRGEAVTIEYSEGAGCGEALGHPSMRFLSSDSLVARVDSVSGRVTGVRAGEARVWLNYLGHTLDPTSYTAEVLVQVR